jgi:hypothetical protein
MMTTYMKELHYGVFNNQSCAKSDFSLSINVAQMKIVPIPFSGAKILSFSQCFGSNN